MEHESNHAVGQLLIELQKIQEWGSLFFVIIAQVNLAIFLRKLQNLSLLFFAIIAKLKLHESRNFPAEISFGIGIQVGEPPNGIDSEIAKHVFNSNTCFHIGHVTESFYGN